MDNKIIDSEDLLAILGCTDLYTNLFFKQKYGRLFKQQFQTASCVRQYSAVPSGKYYVKKFPFHAAPCFGTNPLFCHIILCIYWRSNIHQNTYSPLQVKIQRAYFRWVLKEEILWVHVDQSNIYFFLNSILMKLLLLLQCCILESRRV